MAKCFSVCKGGFLFTFTLVFHNTLASTIDIDIEGDGSVLVVDETETLCDENCVVETVSDFITLQPQASSNATFKQWDGQQCDFGYKVIHGSARTGVKTVGGGAKTLKSADINGDGIADLAAISLFDGKVFSLINDGNGKFSDTVVVDSMRYPSALDLYDWDGDADQDLLVIDYPKREIQLYTNDGNGNFTFSKAIVIPDIAPYALSVMDVNADDAPDLIISSFNADISGDLFDLVESIANASTDIYTNLNGSFELYQNLSSSAAITVDAYKPNSSDAIVIATAEIADNRVVVYSDGEATTVDSGSRPYGVNFNDIDDNGTQDLLVAYYRPSQLAILYQLQSNSFTAPNQILTPSEGLTATSMEDFNNDDIVDIASGEFNANSFFYVPSISYVDCGLSTDSDRSIIAIFSESEQAPENPAVPVSQPDNNSSSGGGSFGMGMLLLSAVAVFRKYFKLTLKA
ncbi:FG-GAP repeat domain-containing protein [Alteromonas sp. ASW11-130]|uniref:FG-GAP repeat domain-containing protein n=1 Tax=Alteromonas sp. ASW11-130 TaxID=3015775 RepID=UPI0022427ABB|nr:VCBS repeat-containing protein [Alteromonas sp. ASW11-130]MCW8091522.1 VCBS repeat-containing protein [Alteromonas sp. ASW11-130]